MSETKSSPLSNIDSTKAIIGGVVVLAIMGVSHAISTGMLASEPVKMTTEQLTTNLARIGGVTLNQPVAAPVAKPAAPAPAPAPVVAKPVEPAAPASAPTPAPAPAVETAPVAEAVAPAPVVEKPAETVAPASAPTPAPAPAPAVETAPVAETVAPAPMPHPQPAWLLHMAPLSTPAPHHAK
ncbi:hypothetical protein CKO09_01625 [Chromatium weissei]|nr:hypothetical protein [Chromatium weissei]